MKFAAKLIRYGYSEDDFLDSFGQGCRYLLSF